jgi:alpha-galactosidase
METNFEKGINAEGANDAYLTDPMKSANRVKMDLFRRYGILGAAGDRHLAEFMDPTLYLSSPKTVRSWSFALTPVSYRIRLQQKKINESIQIATGKKKPILKKSKEEVVELMRSLMGEKRMISNVNLPNEGQMPQMKMGAVVETNALFSLNSVMPIVATKLVDPVRELVSGHLDLTELLYEAIKKRQLEDIYQVFRREPQCRRHPDSDMRQLFTDMVRGTRDQLEHEYDLSCF